MKLKRFVAKDMRTALAKIKEELGAEAVIMSNKRVGPNVEIIAGVEGDIVAAPVKTSSKQKGQITSNIHDDSPLSRIIADDEVTLSASSKSKPESKLSSKTVGGSKSEAFAKSLLEILERQQQGSEQTVQKKTATAKAQPQKTKAKAPAPLSEQTGLRDLFIKEDEKKKEKKVETSHGISSYISKESESEKTEIEQLRHDVDSIRRLLQFELAGLMSDTKKREEPVKAMIYELLLSSGFDKSISNELSESIDSDASFNFAWRQLAQNLERRIKTGSDEIVTDGGIVTLIGPAGVGKTTTIAKLAARFVMKYGPDRVALITADHYRIGAVEQVKTYGRIMGCSTFAIKSIDELPEMLYTLRDKSLVLVDTVGVGLHDERFESQVNALKKQSRLKMKHYLVLPATAQRKVLEHAYEHFSNIGLKGIILTKIDESESLADALSLCIKQKLMLSYVTDGQRVPEDLEVPDARALAIKALSSVESDVAKFALDQSVL
ncbi:flagellar biosynthesis protein FlhF [Succinivibrio dextrinosolvens]|uniref:flagellar biosynthesis protein FlhF n=1 Tax=Succinivibrio dextrinosolvens TaxID=83771 RepID=UPI00247A8772|nr:flagellar biosynthesis protein FlhF [Succinivibrio dextrinosolvens]